MSTFFSGHYVRAAVLVLGWASGGTGWSSEASEPEGRPGPDPGHLSRRAYDEGRKSWRSRSRNGLLRSIGDFERALALQPDFAEAYSGLADSCCLIGLYSIRAPELAFPRAKRAARTALRLDSELSQAHASMGLSLFLYDWDWAEAEQSFRRAIDLGPDYATAHQWYAMLLRASGRHEEAVGSMTRALALAPDSRIVNVKLATVLSGAGRHREAEDRIEEAVNRWPDFALAHREWGHLSLGRGRLEAARVAFEKAVALDGSIKSRAGLAEVDAISGRPDAAREALEEIFQEGRSRSGVPIPPISVALVYAGLRDSESALEWIDRALSSRDPGVVYLGVKSGFADLREDPRFLVRIEGLGSARGMARKPIR